jgi:uncharacterized membrane protein affecting hemolysin expression
MVRAGKAVDLVDCNILDEQQRLVAASSKSMTLRGRVAKEGNHGWKQELDWICNVRDR